MTEVQTRSPCGSWPSHLHRPRTSSADKRPRKRQPKLPRHVQSTVYVAATLEWSARRRPGAASRRTLVLVRYTRSRLASRYHCPTKHTSPRVLFKRVLPCATHKRPPTWALVVARHWFSVPFVRLWNVPFHLVLGWLHHAPSLSITVVHACARISCSLRARPGHTSKHLSVHPACQRQALVLLIFRVVRTSTPAHPSTRPTTTRHALLALALSN